MTESTTTASSRSRRRWLEAAFVVLATTGTFAFFAIFFLVGDSGPIEPDGGDDPGPIGEILTAAYSIMAFVVAVLLVALLEVALWATRSARPSTPNSQGSSPRVRIGDEGE